MVSFSTSDSRREERGWARKGWGRKKLFLSASGDSFLFSAETLSRKDCIRSRKILLRDDRKFPAEIEIERESEEERGGKGEARLFANYVIRF